ncbi:MAG: ROK family protein, partial [[Actinobacillus] rossii]|nr:ROK family protein [[Actinobacillus] rossii]
RAGNTTVRLRWQNFLNYLAKAINTAYLLLERDIILGGEIAPYLKDTDIAILVQLVKQRHPFALPDDFIRISSVQNNASLVGAGLYFIRQARP